MTRYEQNATTKVQRDDKSLFKVQHAVNQNYPRDLGLMCNFFLERKLLKDSSKMRIFGGNFSNFNLICLN